VFRGSTGQSRRSCARDLKSSQLLAYDLGHSLNHPPFFGCSRARSEKTRTPTLPEKAARICNRFDPESPVHRWSITGSLLDHRVSHRAETSSISRSDLQTCVMTISLT
jgi:hypothetical protein